MGAVAHCCLLGLMNRTLLIILLQLEAKSGPVALSAVSLLAPKKEGKTTKEANNTMEATRHQEFYSELSALNRMHIQKCVFAM